MTPHNTNLTTQPVQHVCDVILSRHTHTHPTGSTTWQKHNSINYWYPPQHHQRNQMNTPYYDETKKGTRRVNTGRESDLSMESRCSYACPLWLNLLACPLLPRWPQVQQLSHETRPDFTSSTWRLNDGRERKREDPCL